MAFTDYKRIDEVLIKHNLRVVTAAAVVADPTAPPFGDYFRSELRLNLTDLNPGRSSEIGAGEILIFPIVREVWKNYRDTLSLFSHVSLDYDDDLSGYPDYTVCRLSEYGRIPVAPYLLIVEAKLDDFERAWGQCLAEMLAAQKLNGTPDEPVFGIASNGKAWEFGVLLGREFTQDPGAYAVSDLDALGQALHAVFRACRDMALAHRSPTGSAP